MNDVLLPALDGRTPLGVLAALGVQRLLQVHGGEAVRLSWSPTDLTAVMAGPFDTSDQIVRRLRDIVEEIPPDAVLPGTPSTFPPSGGTKDRMRVPRDELRSLVATADTGSETERWVASLLTDLAADGDQRVVISQFTAPTGQQKMSTMLAKPLEHVRSDTDFLRQAVEGWRRVPEFTGEGLDHRAVSDATDAGDGKPRMRGVPGATWLALMSFPLFRTTSQTGRRAYTSGWHRIRDGRRVVDELRLPVWSQPLAVDSIVSLIEHPAMAPDARGRTDMVRLERLGVLHVCRARRRTQPGGKSAGVLVPVTE
ncbi:hypothetical protein GCM10027062_20790 [Nocardioides hungaricus]